MIALILMQYTLGGAALGGLVGWLFGAPLIGAAFGAGGGVALALALMALM